MIYLFVYIAIYASPYSTGQGNPFNEHKEWVNQGLFLSVESCNKAAAQLGYNPKIVRCVEK